MKHYINHMLGDDYVESDMQASAAMYMLLQECTRTHMTPATLLAPEKHGWFSLEQQRKSLKRQVRRAIPPTSYLIRKIAGRQA